MNRDTSGDTFILGVYWSLLAVMIMALLEGSTEIGMVAIVCFSFAAVPFALCVVYMLGVVAEYLLKRVES